MAKIDLLPGEGVFAEAGSMVNMSGTVFMESQLKGGIISGLKRAVNGDSIFLTRFSAQSEHGFVSFAGTMPGKIFSVTVSTGKDFIAQKSSFLCCEESVNLDIAFTDKIRAGLFGGEGLFVTTLTGPGKIVLQSMDVAKIAAGLIPFLPKPDSKGK